MTSFFPAALEYVVHTVESDVDKWMKFFDFQSQGRDVPPNLFQLVSFILYIPGSNAVSSESVFVNERKMECSKEPYDCRPC